MLRFLTILRVHVTASRHQTNQGWLACLITNQILDSVFKALEDRKFKKDISSTCQNNLPKHGENKTIYRIHR